MGLLSAAAKTALDNGTAAYGFLAELDFASGPERYWTGTWPLVYDGDTYTGVAGIGNVGDVESNDDIRPKNLELELIGAPADALKNGTLTPPDFKHRQLKWIFALIDPEAVEQVLFAKIMYYDMDVLNYVVTPEGAGARLSAEHETIAAARAANRRYTHQDQLAEFPGDLGFQFLAYLASGRSIRWGASGRFFVDIS